MIVIENIICSSQTISCLNDDIKSIKISKKSFENKLLQQRDESIELNIKMKSETELGMKQKILSVENQDEVLRLDDFRELFKVLKLNMTSFSIGKYITKVDVHDWILGIGSCSIPVKLLI